MSVGDEVFRRLQSAARSAAAKAGTGAPTQEYLIRHTLESFLDRLARTAHAEDFLLKGGILLATYGVRRPTKDGDASAVGADVTANHLIVVVHDIASVEVDDGVVFNLDSISVQEIREHADHDVETLVGENVDAHLSIVERHSQLPEIRLQSIFEDHALDVDEGQACLVDIEVLLGPESAAIRIASCPHMFV
ncbi:nucleotidyl transferase AbiEii/AbiGii toxin family protein [Micropruina sp.]|uniref:nucleotidyl transferase AbiEii/AbiGii toxin family protein n=1 Tax=Micropruina sp. TaxID=2737536 RepID=UPI0039E6C9FF